MKNEYYLAIVTLCNALIVAIIAIRQYQLSKDKFKLDLFNKRYAVYKSTQIFLSKISKNAKIELEDIFEFRGGTQDSVFFFGDDIPAYLKTIDEKALCLWEKHETLKDIDKGEERSKIAREKTEVLSWLNKQLPMLKDKFEPYLGFKIWK